MENANPFVLVPLNRLHIRITQELNELRVILAMIDSHLGQLLNDFINSHDVFEMDDLESDDGSIDTPLVSPFLDSDDDSDDEGFESTGRNLVAVVRDVYVFVGSFTYVTDFVVLEDIREFIVSDMANVVIGRPFRAITQLEYDCIKGLISFIRILDTYIFRMHRTMPRLKNFNWSKVPPILVLSQLDLMSGLRYPYEKNKLMYKNCLNLGLEYQVDENMKEWLTHGHVIFDEEKPESTSKNIGDDVQKKYRRK
ncbi:hypothetical protein Tco_0564612 [Tanacetum coccineum]